MRLYLGLPSYRPAFHEAWTCVADLMVMMTSSGVEWKRLPVSQCAWLDVTQNTILQGFRASGGDRLMVIDDDIVFDPYDAMKLIASERDVIGADYPMKRFGRGMVCDRRVGGRTDGDLVECNLIGLGFSCLSRRAVDDIVALNLDTQYVVDDGQPFGGTPAHQLFAPALIDGRKFDADAVFFQRLRAAGHTPWLDTSIPLGHIGTHVYTAKDAF